MSLALAQSMNRTKTEPKDRNVYLALPRRPGPIDEKKIRIPGSPVGSAGNMVAGRTGFSLLNLSFNTLWAKALNNPERITHFAMCHDDILPEALWVERLINEMEARELDILSTVIPIKDNRGLTSTGIKDLATGDLRRICMRELFGEKAKLPQTFTRKEVKEAGIELHGFECLVVNTGLWVCRFDRSWVETFPGFTCYDEIRRQPADPSKWEAVCLPEDWAFSEWATRNNLRVGATTLVKAWHLEKPADAVVIAADGTSEQVKAWKNFDAWGEWEFDQGDVPKG